MIPRPLFAVTALSVAVLLSACQSDEDRLVEYLTSAEALQAAGDLPRAMLQYRNALRIDPDNVEARSAVAAALLSQGDIQQAQFEYTALAERFPQVPEWRRALGEIAFVSADWPALDRHAAALDNLQPGSDAARELALAATYRDAVVSDDQELAAEIAAQAEARLTDKPTDIVLLRLVVDRHLNGDTPEAALPILDRALDLEPRMPELQIARLKLLSDTDAVPQLEARLLELATLYPDDPGIAGLLVARHMSQGRVAEAEAILRALAEGAPRGDAALPTLLVTFLKRVHGPAAALAELDRLRLGDPGEAAETLYAAMAHAIRFDAGQTEAAIDAVQALLEDLDDGTEARTIRVMLANMLDRDGDRPAARVLVERALALDPGDVAALKLRAAWSIETGDSLSATVDLRGAQARAPRDTEVMNLLAATHAMEDKRGLALEQLARAAEMSGHGARESERYARALLSDGRTRVAERVLEAALSAAPMDVPLATLLAELRLDRGDWDGVRALDTHLSRLGDPRADDVRLPLQVVKLLAQDQHAEAIQVLEPALATDDAADTVARVATALTARGHPDQARGIIEYARSVRPDLPRLALIAADIAARAGDPEAAQVELEGLMDDADLGASAAHRLVLLHRGQDDWTRADAALADALSRHPRSLDLRLLEAARLLENGEVAASIALYETLYAERPDAQLIANNLASLLSTTSDRPEDIARAARIAAPLRGNAVPAVADTLGWIAFRQGDMDRALPLLTRAARGLPDDPAVRLRLATAQAATGQQDAARAGFVAVTELAAPGDPSAEAARAALAELGG